MKKRKRNLEAGFYWVKADKRYGWFVAEFSRGTWWVGLVHAHLPGVIGPRIAPPKKGKHAKP